MFTLHIESQVIDKNLTRKEKENTRTLITKLLFVAPTLRDQLSHQLRAGDLVKTKLLILLK